MLKMEEVGVQKPLIDAPSITDDRWSPPLIDEEWPSICQAIFAGIHEDEWRSVCCNDSAMRQELGEVSVGRVETVKRCRSFMSARSAGLLEVGKNRYRVQPSCGTMALKMEEAGEELEASSRLS